MVDADRAGHEALRLPQVEEAVRRRWGEAVFGEDGQIDRAAGRRIVFADPPDGPQERKHLEQLTHPEISRMMGQQLAAIAAGGRRSRCLTPH